jgi:hypothetical protein
MFNGLSMRMKIWQSPVWRWRAVISMHAFKMLSRQLLGAGVETGLSEEDCDLLDTIYVPSKYPMGSVLPDFNPDCETAGLCVELAERVRSAAQKIV